MNFCANHSMIKSQEQSASPSRTSSCKIDENFIPSAAQKVAEGEQRQPAYGKVSGRGNVRIYQTLGFPADSMPFISSCAISRASTLTACQRATSGGCVLGATDPPVGDPTAVRASKHQIDATICSGPPTLVCPSWAGGSAACFRLQGRCGKMRREEHRALIGAWL